MLAIILAPFYLLINYYVVRWMIRWTGTCHRHLKSRPFRAVFLCIYIFMCLTPLTSYLISVNPWHSWLKRLFNYWLGTFLYIVLIIIIFDIIRIILKHTNWIKNETLARRRTFILSGGAAACLIICLSAYGIIHEHRLYVNHYEARVEKSGGKLDHLRIALTADLHLGYSIGTYHVKSMVDKINAENVDLVCIAGDFFDNEYDAVQYPEKTISILKNLKSTYGVYACWGNHDFKEKLLAGFTVPVKNSQHTDARMDNFLEQAGIRLLDDKSVLIDDSFYLAGRKDPQRSKKMKEDRLSPDELLKDLDPNKPILVIDHQPKQLQELADAGCAIDLSGHTHDGQMFPGNLTTKLMWENSWGELKKDNMYSYVTSGVGVWGPAMRVGTDAEIMIIDVYFTK